MKIAVDSAIAHLARRTGADHGAGGLMMAMRGAVSGGLYARPRCSMTPRAIPTSRTAAATCVTRSTSGLCMCVWSTTGSEPTFAAPPSTSSEPA